MTKSGLSHVSSSADVLVHGSSPTGGVLHSTPQVQPVEAAFLDGTQDSSRHLAHNLTDTIYIEKRQGRNMSAKEQLREVSWPPWDL